MNMIERTEGYDETQRYQIWRTAIVPQINQAKPESRNHHIELPFSNLEAARQLFGENNCNLKAIAEKLRVTIDTRGNAVLIEGDDIETTLAGNVITQFYDLIKGFFLVAMFKLDKDIQV